MKKRILAIMLIICMAMLCACGNSVVKNESAQTVTVTSETEETETTTEEEDDDSYITTDSVNVRSEPSTDGEVLGQLASGKVITSLGIEDGWCHITYEGKDGYVSQDYIAKYSKSSGGVVYETSAIYSFDGDLTTLDSTGIGYGFNRNDRDENNIPNNMYTYMAKYSGYADFLQDTSKKIIYLTMDEGYENGDTPTILDILKEKNVKAVFFLTGQFIETCPDLVQRMIDEGHILGNHTENHPVMPDESIEDQTEEIMSVHNKILEDYGYEMHLFRFPTGEFSEQSLALVNSLGYRAVFWSFAYGDYDTDDQPDVAESLELCIEELHPGAIYLLHAVSDTNTALLADWIDAARAAGYEFGTYPVPESTK